mgnify:CR=1 FL=1
MALKFPRRRVRNSEVQDVQDMNDTLLPVVEEMGRLNEHNFSSTMSNEITITDMATDVAFKVAHGSKYIDVSTNNTGLTTLTRVPQNELWTPIHPTQLTKTFTSEDGGMFRLIAGGQYSVDISAFASTSYTLFGFRIDGAVLPDCIIGDQDYFSSDIHMEIGTSGVHDSFLLDFIVHLTPGIHKVEVVAQTRNIGGVKREGFGTTDPKDLFIFSAEALYWEMSR